VRQTVAVNRDSSEHQLKKKARLPDQRGLPLNPPRQKVKNSMSAAALQTQHEALAEDTNHFRVVIFLRSCSDAITLSSSSNC
jgi:hypothetical protein